MNIKLKMLSPGTGIIAVLLFCFSAALFGQQAPLYPVSYRIFSPFIFNPAIAGSKDFFSLDLLTSKLGNFNSQIASCNLRLPKSHHDYSSSPDSPEFTKIGIGGSVFTDLNGLSRNTGITAAVSYHIPLGKKNLSFLSFGVSGKGIYNQYSGKTDLSDTAKNTFIPNLDAGVYYYNQSFFAGISATNLLGNPDKPDSLGVYKIPVSTQLFFQIGYKIVLSKSLNILIEPSIVINSDDSFSKKIKDMLKPELKLYAGSFCAGTYFNDFSKKSFFLQYKYPRFYIGTYFELPNNSPFYKNPIRAELAFGINLSAIKHGSSMVNHW
jgi:type IX secretion system PorP/SprF family membrane protein